ncbi:MAG: DNA translocase FtsK [Paludibacter sp.]|nr:DNA translocase FtsK [Paludibacter sp.]
MPPRKPVRTSITPKEETKTIPLNVSGKKKKKTAGNSDSPGVWKQFAGFLKSDRLHFIIGLTIFLVLIYLSVGMVSYFFTGAEDQSKMELSLEELHVVRKDIQNITSVAGALFAHYIIHKGFGIGAFAILFFAGILSFRLMKKKICSLWKAFFHASFWLIWLSISLGFIDSYFKPPFFFLLGGEHGVYVSEWLISYIGELGLVMAIGGSLLIYSIITTAKTITFLRNLFSGKKNKTDDDTEEVIVDMDDEENSPSVAVGTEIVPEEWIKSPAKEDQEDEEPYSSISGDVAFEIEKPLNEEENKPVDLSEFQNNNEENDDPFYNLDKLGKYDPTLDLSRYKFPTLDLLKVYGTDNETLIDMKEQNANKERITTTLQNYGIEIKTIKATVGPTITLYEIVPKEGVRISKIRNLEYDIMLSLAATGIRIIAPIPGKGTIGIEVPNADPQVVSMHSVIASKKFQESKFELPIAFGRTITNEIFMVDLTKMPHLLVAGATGQGKSVGLNAIITSLLYKKHPAVLKFVLIDPKKVEFNIYGDIEKHYLAKLPDGEDAIITDTTKVVETLSSLCREMDDRYDLLKKAHVRNIKEYNEKFINRQLNPEKGHKFLPYIVVIIDEFGDLIMTAGKEIELPIARIAQLARAIGIHMIIATQRPSVNIITGVIKANFPARVAFRVSSMIDSRTIIDGPGANQLVGRGDMLFTSGNELIRVQCAFVDTPEVENIVHHIGGQTGYPSAFYLPEYVGAEGEGLDMNSIDMSKRDPLFEEAARLIVSSQQGSTSNIQRKFSIGYNRAGRIVDQLEVAGIIGPNEGSKARQVLVMDEYHLEQILKQLR